jgi:hypothetical protein
MQNPNSKKFYLEKGAGLTFEEYVAKYMMCDVYELSRKQPPILFSYTGEKRKVRRFPIIKRVNATDVITFSRTWLTAANERV